MEVMSLETPAKPAKKSQALVFEEEEEAEEVPELESLRTSFVGDIEVTEGIRTLLTILCTSPDYAKKRPRAAARGNEATICAIPHSIP
jgi:hypothetical protein